MIYCSMITGDVTVQRRICSSLETLNDWDSYPVHTYYILTVVAGGWNVHNTLLSTSKYVILPSKAP